MIGKPNAPLKKAKYIKGTILNLALSGLENNYYHYNVEFLARYYLYFVSKIKADFIIYPLNTKFQSEFADLLNIDRSKIIDKKDLPVIKADFIVSPCLINNWRLETYSSQLHYLKEWVPSWLKEAYKLPNFKTSNQFKNIKNIYISREKANT